MRLLTMSALASAVAAQGCAPPTPSLDQVITFADPFRCVPGADFDALLGSILDIREQGDGYVAVLSPAPPPAAFAWRIGEPRLTTNGAEFHAVVPLRGTWQGLPVRSVELMGQTESEAGFSLVFDASRDDVLAAANRAGFRLPPSGREYRDEEVMGMSVSVLDHADGGAELNCFPG